MLLASCMILPLFSACSFDRNTPYSKTGFYFDTIITVTVYGKKNVGVLDECMEIAKRYEKLFSAQKEGTDIYKINHSNGEPVEVDPETADLIEKGLYYGEISNHAFSISCGALTSLWDFEEGNSEVIPSEDDIKTALLTIDDSKVEVEGNTVTLKPIQVEESDSKKQSVSIDTSDISSSSSDNDARNSSSAANDDSSNSFATELYPQIDLGAIAKGYIADKMKEYLINNSLDSAIINLGGNVLTVGTRPNGKPFNVGIQKPFSDDGIPACSISANGSYDSKSSSIVTSGTYQRYFEKDGKIYHHILNLTTGFPEDNNLSSVTIISEKSTDGDALSTICFLLGENKARELLKSLGSYEAIFIDNVGNISYTDGLKNIISLQ